MTDPDAELRAWAPKPTDPTLPADGMRLAGYSDFVLVAEGGEGTVYRARQDGLDRFVAVKVINVDDPARLARFRRELEITVRLGRQHPHIVTVLDTATAPDGRPCIVMEYYDAGSLHDRLRSRGPLPVADVVAAGVAVADALAFAHEHGFLHRDVKPQNILVLPTSYVLADFGIARMADAGHTTSLQLVSYRHAAPQMIDGEEPSALDDLWSLGSTLFTLLDGEPPFASESSDTMLSYLGRVRSDDPRQIRRADVPPALAEVLARCLSKRREDRFPNAGALRMALAAIDTSTQGWTPSLPIADFGPRPTPYVPSAPLPEPPPPNDRDRTVAGAGSELAGLTVRLPESQVPDFGPLPPDEVAVLPPPVLPPSVQWRQDEDLTAPRTPPAPRKRLWLLGLAAVVVGGAVGVALTVLNGQEDKQATPPPPTTTTTTTQETTAAPPITGGDPAFAPTLTRLDDNGDTIRLTWTDPTAGKLQFVIVDTSTTDVKALATATAGSTTYTVTGLDPDADQYCYRILGIGLDDPTTQRGASASLCTDR